MDSQLSIPTDGSMPCKHTIASLEAEMRLIASILFNDKDLSPDETFLLADLTCCIIGQKDLLTKAKRFSKVQYIKFNGFHEPLCMN